MVWVLVALSFVLFAIGTPVFACFGLVSSIICVTILGLPPETVGQRLWAYLNNFTMLAAPLFIWSGSLMLCGGTSKRLIDAFNSFCGHFPGGLAIGVVVTSTFFSAMSGSTVATAAAMGAFLMPEMERAGYDKSFAGGVIASTAPLGPIIPPSIFMVLYAGITEANVAKLFLAGTIPGLIIAAMMIPYVVWVAKHRKYSKSPKATWHERRVATWKAIPALSGPIFVLGGMYAGVVTATEAACVAVIYAIVVGWMYRDLTIKNFWSSLIESAKATSVIFILVVGSLLLGFVLFQTRIQDQMIKMFSESYGAYGFLVLYMIIGLIMGCFVDALVIMFLTVPLLYPVALALGIDPVLLGLLLTINLCIGQITPPFGIAVFTVSAFSHQPSGPMFRESWPFIWMYTFVLFLCVFVPPVAMWLPDLYG